MNVMYIRRAGMYKEIRNLTHFACIDDRNGRERLGTEVWGTGSCCIGRKEKNRSI